MGSSGSVEPPSFRRSRSSVRVCEAKVTFSQMNQTKPQIELPNILEYIIMGSRMSGTIIQPRYNGSQTILRHYRRSDAPSLEQTDIAISRGLQPRRYLTYRYALNSCPLWSFGRVPHPTQRLRRFIVRSLDGRLADLALAVARRK